MHNSISFVKCGELLPMKEYLHQAHPAETAQRLLDGILGYATSENDIRHSYMEFSDNTLYIVYTALVPMVGLVSGFKWHKIEEIFDEKTNELVRDVVSKSVSYS